jgi:hypothetical protein
VSDHDLSEKLPTTRLVQRRGRPGRQVYCGLERLELNASSHRRFQRRTAILGCVVCNPIWRAAPTSIGYVSILTKRSSRLLYRDALTIDLISPSHSITFMGCCSAQLGASSHGRMCDVSHDDRITMRAELRARSLDSTKSSP